MFARYKGRTQLNSRKPTTNKKMTHNSVQNDEGNKPGNIQKGKSEW